MSVKSSVILDVGPSSHNTAGVRGSGMRVQGTGVPAPMPVMKPVDDDEDAAAALPSGMMSTRVLVSLIGQVRCSI